MQAGRRPAVILHSDISFDKLQVVLVVPGTSKLKALRFPHTVRVEPSEENGLIVPTVFLGFQVQAIDKRIIDLPVVGKLSGADMEAVEDAVLAALGFTR